VKLRYTIHAAKQLDAILTHIAQESPQGARRVQARIQSIMNLLLQYPEVGRLTSRQGIRRIVTFPYPYLIFYRIVDDEVVVHGVRHGAQTPEQ
jgi:toxin ParE1/3/4